MDISRISGSAPGWNLTRVNRKLIRAAMQEALKSETAVSAGALAAQLGCANSVTLKRADAKLYSRIVLRYRSEWRNRPPRRKASNAEAVLRANLRLANPVALRPLAFRHELPSPTTLRRRFPTLCNALDQKRRRVANSEREKAAEGLKRALSVYPPITLSEVGRRVGVSVEKLQRHNKELFDKLTRRYQRYRKDQIRKQRVELTSMCKEYPPPSLCNVSGRLGVDPRALRKNHAEAVKQLERRRQRFLDENKRQGEEMLFKNIVESVRVLFADDRRITVSSVAEESKKRGVGWIDSRAEPLVKRAVNLLLRGHGDRGAGRLCSKAA